MKNHALKTLLVTLMTPFFVACSPKIDDSRPLADQVRDMYDSYRNDFPDIQEASVQDVQAWRNEGNVVLVDVREKHERDVSMIHGAITKEAFESDPEEHADKKIVAYCTIGYRSGNYVEELQNRGIEAFNLKGSILAWVNEGLPLTDSAGEETKRVHVYGKKWNLVPGEYEGVW